MVEKTQIVIIGGGIAGAATAYFLARQGCKDMIILEKELLPGTHSSGRNAAMMRQTVPEEVNCRLAFGSMGFFADPPSDFGHSLDFQRNGSLLLASGKTIPGLRKNSEMHRRIGLEVHELTPKETLKIVPVLNPKSFESAFYCASDGTINIHSLLQGFLQGAAARGARLKNSTEVQSILTEKGKVRGVVTNQGEILAEKVVNAAGAWASLLSADSSFQPPIHPSRRHLVVTEVLPWVEPNWPFSWFVSEGFYFRPECGAILMSPCDQEEIGPCNAQPDQKWVDQAAEKACRFIPKIGDAGIAHRWAGLRNITPDHCFIVGEDPRVRGYYWVAGLGGHGMTAAPMLGQVAADLILRGKTECLDARPMSPSRFLQNTAP